MKLTAFQSDEGDCLLLESSSGKHRMLVDGGIRRAYASHVAPELGRLRKAKKKIDILYVSHIDEDHIAGVLELLNNEAAWRVHDFRRKNDPDDPPPDASRPPVVSRIFHNSFHHQIGKNGDPIEDMLAATAQILSASDNARLREIAAARSDLVTGIRDAVRVSGRIKPNQLNIPLNPHFGGKLMMVKAALPVIRLGTIRLKVIGPFPGDLDKLRKEWNKWFEERAARLEEINQLLKRDESDFGTSEVSAVLRFPRQSAALLGASELASAKFGQRSAITAPNLASLMFLAEEKGQRILLTGDGAGQDILKGLEHHRAFDANDHCHVDVLKVQHHGAKANIDEAFCNRVTADHYVFCGNGEHDNPEVDVLQLIFDRRMAAGDTRKFKFWFNSNSTASVASDDGAQMRKVETLVGRLATQSGGRLRFKFITGSKLRIV